jgi:hypothetical protein
MVFHGCVVMRPSTAMVIETMDGGAFGSLVAAVNVANTGIGSVGQRVVQANRTRLFQDPSGSTHRNIQVPERGTVELLGLGDSVVGMGVIDCRMI